jgi:hypothetical protein
MLFGVLVLPGLVFVAIVVGVSIARAGIASDRVRDGNGSYQGGEGKSRDDFELHIVLFVVILNSEY